MKLLAVNTGSSSLKFKLFAMPSQEVLIAGTFEKINETGSFYRLEIKEQKIQKEVVLTDHKQAFELVVSELLANAVVTNLEEIVGIGHRVVQGGDYFADTVFIDEDVIAKIQELAALAPLHNPAAIIGIDAARRVFPKALQTAVFDTAFHQTMKEETFLYALPYKWYEDYKIRRYGAHGTSHKFVARRMNEILNIPHSRIITCHLGNGGSISAVVNNVCLNTSMGLTPNAGVIMGTRCGDIDATIVTYMMQKYNLSAAEVEQVLNKESGYLGISGVSSDSRDIEKGIAEGNARCLLARKMFVRRVVDYIAKYYFEMKGLDALVFTAGIGENSVLTRAAIMAELAFIGITIDEQANSKRAIEIKVSAADSQIPCYVIPTNEELMIALDTYDLINKRGQE